MWCSLWIITNILNTFTKGQSHCAHTDICPFLFLQSRNHLFRLDLSNMSLIQVGALMNSLLFLWLLLSKFLFVRIYLTLPISDLLISTRFVFYFNRICGNKEQNKRLESSLQCFVFGNRSCCGGAFLRGLRSGCCADLWRSRSVALKDVLSYEAFLTTQSGCVRCVMHGYLSFCICLINCMLRFLYFL